MRDRLTIVYMGTPDFAVPGLDALIRDGHHLPLVVTQPDRPRGRGRKLSPPPLKTAAENHGCRTIQPDSPGSREVLDRIAALAPDLLVVVAYGALLPRSVLDLPSRGAVNIHPSLLPAYRGPAPIQWAIINGERETGVTSIFMTEAMDAGDIILTEKVPVLPEETAGQLHDRLAEIGAALLSRTVRAIVAGEADPVAQDDNLVTYAPRLTKADGRVDWSRPAERLVDFIRGMTPWPGAHTIWGDRRLNIQRAKAVKSQVPAAPGTVIQGFPGELRVKAGQDALSILTLQGASGKIMDIGDFLRGCPIPENSVLS